MRDGVWASAQEERPAGSSCSPCFVLIKGNRNDFFAYESVEQTSPAAHFAAANCLRWKNATSLPRADFVRLTLINWSAVVTPSDA